MGLLQAEAEEIAQETFLRAWNRLADYNPRRGEFSTWLFTIARNLALHELNRAAASREVATPEPLPDAAAETPPPCEAVSEMEQRRRLRTALRQLPLADGSALALSCFKELDLAAVARIEGCSVGAIKVRLHRARQRLRQLDALVERGLLRVPDDFAERVMRNVAMAPLPPFRPRWGERLQWLALSGGALWAAVELAAFTFGIWSVSAAY
jgi:RNA polymerase sigma-70 factor (ECF subfamily)